MFINYYIIITYNGAKIFPAGQDFEKLRAGIHTRRANVSYTVCQMGAKGRFVSKRCFLLYPFDTLNVFLKKMRVFCVHKVSPFLLL